jgi:pyruvate dehydrogenase E1 component
VLDRARAAGAPVEVGLSTQYVNTIPVDQEEQIPGDQDVERKLRNLMRWNAIATVLQSNKESSELGGHIASYQSAATLYEVGFNHFWSGPTDRESPEEQLDQAGEQCRTDRDVD